MSANSTAIQALNYMGHQDQEEETLILDKLQEQALLKRILKGRDDLLYEKLYGQKHVRDIYTPVRAPNTGTRADPFWK